MVYIGLISFLKYLVLNGLKINGTHQLLAYVDDVNILGGNIYSLKENTEL